ARPLPPLAGAGRRRRGSRLLRGARRRTGTHARGGVLGQRRRIGRKDRPHGSGVAQPAGRLDGRRRRRVGPLRRTLAGLVARKAGRSVAGRGGGGVGTGREHRAGDQPRARAGRDAARTGGAGDRGARCGGGAATRRDGRVGGGARPRRGRGGRHAGRGGGAEGARRRLGRGGFVGAGTGGVRAGRRADGGRLGGTPGMAGACEPFVRRARGGRRALPDERRNGLPAGARGTGRGSRRAGCGAV
ncbi:MAG: hypothetical protein AVDCRST_MAG08-815, partial [uncultured Acetobacteraceae bacterium]